AFSLLLCSCLVGCSQIKEAALSALDDADDASVAQTEGAGTCGDESAEAMGIREGGCVVGTAGECANNGGELNNGCEPDVFANDDGGEYGEVQQLAANAGGKKGAKAATKAGGNVFSLVDQGTNLVVESYKLPAGWKGTGQVLRPPMKNITWQSIFVHPQVGSVGFRNFSTSYDGVGPYRSSPILQNNNIATGLLSDLRQFLNMQNVKVVSSSLSPHNTPENQQTIQFMKSKVAPSLRANFTPLQYHAVVSMTCNGQPYKGDLISNLLCWEYTAGRVTLHGISIQNSYGVVAPASQLPQEQKSVLGILASRQENPQWVQYGMQYTAQQNQQNNAHYDRMNQIVQDKNNYISNVQQHMNQSNAATMDRVRQGQHEMITETTDIANPYNPGYTVTTDNNYNHAWTNSNGEVINTDSTLYNPNSDQDLNGVDWTQIK
ncbi:hypothetical protein IJT17_01795, partial [bacterium]|nr:hypothetical protein [bacterium]